jgi:hypothetical protein
MAEERNGQPGGTAQLGGTPEGRIQRYFCIDDEECRAFSRVSKEARVLRRIPKQVWVMGKEVNGWIVEIMVPATDGVVRFYPRAKAEKD